MDSSCRILIVEDSATQAARLTHLLEMAYPELDIAAVDNGEEALASVEVKRPALIISDIVMPVMNGYEMCSALKQKAEFRDIPVILLTSLSDSEDIVRGLNAGTNYYLTKPYDEEFLVQKIQDILRQPTGPTADGDSGWRVILAGREHRVRADLQQMLNLLLSTYDNAVQQNRKLLALQDELQRANDCLEERVRARTAELSLANEQLRVEVWERKAAEERLKLQLRRLDALRHIDVAITSSLDLRVTMDVLLDQVTSQLSVDAADVLLYHPALSRLELVAGRGFQTPLSGSQRRDLKGPAERAVREGSIVRIDHLVPGEACPLSAARLNEEGFVSYVAAPLVAKGRVEGVLEVFDRDMLPDDGEWRWFLEALAGQAAIAIDNALLFKGLQRSNVDLLDAYETTLQGWSKAMDMRDKETEGHSSRVTEMTERLARILGVEDEVLVDMRRGALLHDIGKLGVPDNILLKPGPLTPQEREIMEQHPVYAYQWLSSIAFLRDALDIPYCHHEKWDGTGYPQGIGNRDIPRAARIFAVADVWDALRSDRPYREAWSRARCLAHIRQGQGTHFDPEVVDALNALYEDLGENIDPLPAVSAADAG